MDSKYTCYSWIVQEYDGCLGIYTSRCLNTFVLESVLIQMQNDGYTIHKIFNDYYRAIK